MTTKTKPDLQTSKPPGRWQRMRDLAFAHPVLAVFALALVLRVGLALAVYAFVGGYVFGDDTLYPDLAASYLDGMLPEGYYTRLYHLTAAYTYPLTVFIFIGLPIPLTAQLYTAVVGSGVAAITTALLLHVSEERRALALIAGCCAAVMPSQVLFTSLVLKDSTVWLGVVLVALAIAHIRSPGRQAPRVTAVAALIFGLVVVNFTRQHVLIICCAALILSALISLTRDTIVTAVVLVSIGVFLPASLGLGLAGFRFASGQPDPEIRRVANAYAAETAFVDASRLGEATIAQDPFEQALASSADTDDLGSADQSPGSQGSPLAVATADTDDLGSADQSPGSQGSPLAVATADPELESISDPDARPTVAAVEEGQRTGTGLRGTLQALPRGLQALMLDPLPWVVTGNIRVDIVKVEHLLWYPTLLLGVAGAFLALRRRHQVCMFLAFFSGATVLVYAVTEGNFGTAYRHRGEVVSSAIVLATYMIAELLRRRESGPVQKPSEE